MPISKHHFIEEDPDIAVSSYRETEVDVLCIGVHLFF